MGCGQTKLKHRKMAIEQVYVGEDGKATIVCAKCNRLKVVPTSHFKKRQHRIKVKCACSHIFIVNLDFRQAFRKPTSFTGIYLLFPPVSGGGIAQIHNISFKGISFEVRGIHAMDIGHKGCIDFTLDNKKLTHLKKEIIVRSVIGNRIGCEFNKVQAFEKDLGYYLRFN